MPELKKTGSDLIPYIGVDRDNDGLVDTIEVKLVRNVVSVDQNGNIVADYVWECRGLSTDTKPTTDVPLYSTFIEMDKRNIYYWTGTEWVGF